MRQYFLVWFSGNGKRTARLVLNTDKFSYEKLDISEVSRMFPKYEATIMKRFHRSELFPIWKDAFMSEQEN